ncbi:hypothetical protein E4U11_000118 [Claviceps purpurea]|nr:hypothetical protein E4U11_000118 [Claviceps purpurea]
MEMGFGNEMNVTFDVSFSQSICRQGGGQVVAPVRSGNPGTPNMEGTSSGLCHMNRLRSEHESFADQLASQRSSKIRSTLGGDDSDRSRLT